MTFCSVHVIFGHVIFGQDLVSQIESMQTDEAGSRPLTDVRVENCGELVPQMKTKGMLNEWFLQKNFICGSNGNIDKTKVLWTFRAQFPYFIMVFSKQKFLGYRKFSSCCYVLTMKKSNGNTATNKYFCLWILIFMVILSWNFIWASMEIFYFYSKFGQTTKNLKICTQWNSSLRYKVFNV